MVGKTGAAARGVDTTLLVRVARMYYERDMTHQAIADELDLSRVKVTRLLAHAREQGIVRISVHDPERPSADLEEELAQALGLREVRIARADAHEDERAVLVSAGAAFLGELLPGCSTVAFGVSSVIADSVARLDVEVSPHTVMVPMSGGWAGPSSLLNPDSSAWLAARRLGARAYAMTAPLVAPDADSATALASDRGVAAVLDLARCAEVVVMGVGVGPGGAAWSDALLGRALTDGEVRDLIEAGAIGDISGRFYDVNGHAVTGTFDGRVIGLALPEIAAIPERVAIAGGVHKADAIRGAARGGLLTALVTDLPAARALLAG